MASSPSRLPFRLAVGAQRAAARALRYAGHGLDAATLGVFPDAGLDALTATFYTRVPKYHGNGHNQNGFFDWERTVVDEVFPADGTILVTSAGGGREALALVASGRRVIATECVESLARALADHLAEPLGRGAAHVAHTAPDEVPARHGPFDGAIVGWTAYGHLPGRKRRLAFLERLRGALRPGAPLLLSYWGAAQGHGRAARAVAQLASLCRAPFGRRAIEPGETAAAGFFMRVFEPGEAAAEARAAGFDLVDEVWVGCPHLVARAPKSMDD